MLLTLQRQVDVIDASDPLHQVHRPIMPGTHEVQRIENPLGHELPWIVLAGTKIGQAEQAWRKWQGPEWGELQVVIRE